MLIFAIMLLEMDSGRVMRKHNLQVWPQWGAIQSIKWSESYLVQPSTFVSQQHDGVADLSRRGDSSDGWDPGESRRGLESNCAGDGAGCVFSTTWVLIHWILNGNRNIVL